MPHIGVTSKLKKLHKNHHYTTGLKNSLSYDYEIQIQPSKEFSLIAMPSTDPAGNHKPVKKTSSKRCYTSHCRTAPEKHNAGASQQQQNAQQQQLHNHTRNRTHARENASKKSKEDLTSSDIYEKYTPGYPLYPTNKQKKLK